METTPAYKFTYDYLKNKFPKMDEKTLKANTEKWMGLMRTQRFEEWLNSQR